MTLLVWLIIRYLKPVLIEIISLCWLLNCILNIYLFVFHPINLCCLHLICFVCAKIIWDFPIYTLQLAEGEVNIGMVIVRVLFSVKTIHFIFIKPLFLLFFFHGRISSSINSIAKIWISFRLTKILIKLLLNCLWINISIIFLFYLQRCLTVPTKTHAAKL